MVALYLPRCTICLRRVWLPMRHGSSKEGNLLPVVLSATSCAQSCWHHCLAFPLQPLAMDCSPFRRGSLPEALRPSFLPIAYPMGMNMGDIIAMIIIGLSVFGPALSKWQQKMKAKAGTSGSTGSPANPSVSRSTPSGERATGLQVPRRASLKSGSKAQAASGSSSSQQTSVMRTVRRKPAVARSVSKAATPAKPKSTAAKRATKPETPEAEIAARHALRDAQAKGQEHANWGKAARRRSWTRLHEAMVYTTMLERPKALQDED